jgi:hypothetical protein
MRIRLARRRFVPVLFSLSPPTPPNEKRRPAGNLRLIRLGSARLRLDSAAAGG